MKHVGKLVMVAAVVMVLTSHSSAAVITLGTAGTVDDLFSGTATAAGSLLITDFDTSRFEVDLYSQAYTNGSEYAYLYQIDNSANSTDPVELFTLSPFAGADASTLMGYLTGTVPTGFLAGVDQNPEATGNVNASGPIISFYYTSRAGFEIDPGQQSAVMYVMSDLAPDLIWGSVINGTTDTEQVVGPIPEPTTMSLLALGGLALIRRRT